MKTVSPWRWCALASISLAGFPAAAQPPRIAPSGVEGHTIVTAEFDRVEIDGAGEVKLVQSDRDEVFVGGDGPAQAGVQVEVTGRRLELNLPGAWKFWNNDKPQVEVRVRQLRGLVMMGAGNVYASGTFNAPVLSIEVSGSGIVHFDDLQVARLNFAISGSGEGQLAGRADQARFDVSGRGKLTAPTLQVHQASVSISGVGTADLWATDSLNVDISGAGHVRYAGQPHIRQSISGLGSVEASGERR